MRRASVRPQQAGDLGLGLVERRRRALDRAGDARPRRPAPRASAARATRQAPMPRAEPFSVWASAAATAGAPRRMRGSSMSACRSNSASTSRSRLRSPSVMRARCTRSIGRLVRSRRRLARTTCATVRPWQSSPGRLRSALAGDHDWPERPKPGKSRRASCRRAVRLVNGCGAWLTRPMTVPASAAVTLAMHGGRPHDSRMPAAVAAELARGSAGSASRHVGRAALTMIKKALRSAFHSMPKPIGWLTQLAGSCGQFCGKPRRPVDISRKAACLPVRPIEGIDDDHAACGPA